MGPLLIMETTVMKMRSWSWSADNLQTEIYTLKSLHRLNLGFPTCISYSIRKTAPPPLPPPKKKYNLRANV